MQPAPDFPPLTRGNYFAEGAYVTTDVKKGVMRNRAGTRMIALTSDFLTGLCSALEAECGPAAPAVLRSCGRTWGRRVGERLAKELEEFYGMPVAEFTMSLYEACLTEAFSHDGWGRLTFDFSRHDRGLIVVRAKDAIFAALAAKADRPVDTLLAAVLAGVLSAVSGQPLDCVQTACQACGAGEGVFVVALADRLAKVADWPAKGRPHDEVVEALEAAAA
jgi:hypothetical protein